MRLMLQENPKLGMSAKAFVDGVDVSRWCFGADEELGEAYCYVAAENGMIAIDHSDVCKADSKRCTLGEGAFRGCEMRTEIRKGVVKIQLPEAA